MREWWTNIYGQPEGQRRFRGLNAQSRGEAEMMAEGPFPPGNHRPLYRIHVKLKEGRA